MVFLRRKREVDESKLNMTPMIDVVFQLLIFFLVGTKFRVPEGELEAYLPEEGAPQQVTRRDVPVDEIHISLLVSQAGAKDPNVPPTVLLDKSAGTAAATGMSMATLSDHLRQISSDKRMREEVPIIIEAEPHLAYRWVIYVLNMCRRERFQKVNFAASKRNAPLPKGASAIPAPKSVP